MQSGPPFAPARLRGALLGAIVGDALSFPYLHHSRAYLGSLGKAVVEEYREHFSGLHPPGQPSELSQELLAVLEGLIEDGGEAGEATAFQLEALRRGSTLVARGHRAAPAGGSKAAPGASPRALAPPGQADAAPLVRALPAALLGVEADGPWLATAEACLRLTHSDPRVIAAGCAFAAMLRHNLAVDAFLLGPFLDAGARAAGRLEPALEAAILDFPRLLSLSEARALRAIERLLPDDRYPVSPTGLSDYAIPAMVAAVYCFLRRPFSTAGALQVAIGLGGQLGVCACLTGALTGALAGEESIPPQLTDGLAERASIHSAAAALLEAVRGKASPEPRPAGDEQEEAHGPDA